MRDSVQGPSLLEGEQARTSACLWQETGHHLFTRPSSGRAANPPQNTFKRACSRPWGLYFWEGGLQEGLCEPTYMCRGDTDASRGPICEANTELASRGRVKTPKEG